jgi:hypothetical protein
MTRKCLLFAVFWVAVVTSARSQSYQLHSVFIYSFTRYVQWPPEESTGDFEILVLGESGIYNELTKMAETKKVGSRAIKVSRITSAAEIRKCNILFVPVEKSAALGDVLGKVGSNATLVVTEQVGLGAKGSCINFVEKDGKLAFEINQAAMTKQRLKASSELMRFGTVI